MTTVTIVCVMGLPVDLITQPQTKTWIIFLQQAPRNWATCNRATLSILQVSPSFVPVDLGPVAPISVNCTVS